MVRMGSGVEPLRGQQSMTNEGAPLFPCNVLLAANSPRYSFSNLLGRLKRSAAQDKAGGLQNALVGKAITTDQSLEIFPITSITQTSSHSSYVNRNAPGTYAASEIIVVTVGPEPKTFYIHKDLLLSKTRNISGRSRNRPAAMATCLC